MIKTKSDFYYYLSEDKLALGINRKIPIPYVDCIWNWQRLYRKTEYIVNCKKSKILKAIYRLRLKKKSIKLGFSIPINVFGPGLAIVHYGTIVVNGTSRVGKNCRIHSGVTLGATNGNPQGPILGNNIFLGDGCKIIGDIYIADNVSIGANAVVCKNISDSGTTWAGVPAKKISNNDSSLNIKKR